MAVASAGAEVLPRCWHKGLAGWCCLHCTFVLKGMRGVGYSGILAMTPLHPSPPDGCLSVSGVSHLTLWRDLRAWAVRPYSHLWNTRLFEQLKGFQRVESRG